MPDRAGLCKRAEAGAESEGPCTPPSGKKESRDNIARSAVWIRCACAEVQDNAQNRLSPVPPAPRRIAISQERFRARVDPSRSFPPVRIANRRYLALPWQRRLQWWPEHSQSARWKGRPDRAQRPQTVVYLLE